MRLARLRMLLESKPKERVSLPIRGFTKRGERIKRIGQNGPIRLKVRK